MFFFYILMPSYIYAMHYPSFNTSFCHSFLAAEIQVVCPCPGAIYMYMTVIFKHNRLTNQSQILCGPSLGT